MMRLQLAGVGKTVAEAAIASLAQTFQLALVKAVAHVSFGKTMIGHQPDGVFRDGAEHLYVPGPLLRRPRQQEWQCRPLWMGSPVFTKTANGIDDLVQLRQLIAEDHLICLDDPVLYAITPAIADGAGYFAAAAGGGIHDHGPDPDAAGPAQIDAVTGFQPA